MCLTTKQKKPRIARKDIEIYKLVVKDSLNEQKYLSLYEKFPYELNKVYEEPANEDNDKNCSWLVHNTFGEGWFHSFKDYTIALFNSDISYSRIIGNDIIIISGIIPKGTPYYLGIYGDICSKKIKLVREL